MEKTVLMIEAKREAYGAYDLKTIKVGELINLLKDYDPDTPVVLSFDKGYTYGGVRYSRMRLEDVCEEE